MNPFQKILRLFTPAKPQPAPAAAAVLPAVALDVPGWHPFEKGRSIGTRGSEGGRIVADLESPDGARITLEQDGDTAPFTVTFGIYSLMFHTHFCATLDEGLAYMKGSIWGIGQVFELYATPEAARNADWQLEHERLLADLVA